MLEHCVEDTELQAVWLALCGAGRRGKGEGRHIHAMQMGHF
jgi:hypothetical protein